MREQLSNHEFVSNGLYSIGHTGGLSQAFNREARLDYSRCNVDTPLRTRCEPWSS